jgi:D-serine deaminase-like pyridoxal phosphate-dependent protein
VVVMSNWKSEEDVGTYIESLETPVPVVDLDRLAVNLDRMAAYATLHGLQLRPHVKTHKSPRIAAEQMQRGASGLTVATLREAEVMSEVCDDLLIAFPPIGAARLERMVRLPNDVKITVTLDGPTGISALALAAKLSRREIDVYIEADLGMHRVGVQNVEEAIALARQVRDTTSLRYAGMMFYPGHIREHISEQSPAIEKLTHDIARYCDALASVGLQPGVVSGGSTPLAWRIHDVPGVTEVRPGTYVYNDRTTAAIGACHWDDCALTIAATVVSVAVPGQAVIDAGTKALGREPMRAASDGYGALLDHPDVVVARMSEEHGMLDLSRSDYRPRIGDVVRVVPNHVCIAVHLFDEIIGVRGTSVETRWPVTARGRGSEGEIGGGHPSGPRMA